MSCVGRTPPRRRIAAPVTTPRRTCRLPAGHEGTADRNRVFGPPNTRIPGMPPGMRSSGPRPGRPCRTPRRIPRARPLLRGTAAHPAGAVLRSRCSTLPSHRIPAGRFSGDLNPQHPQINSHAFCATTRSGPEPESRQQMYGPSGGGPLLPKSMFTRTGGTLSLTRVPCGARPRWRGWGPGGGLIGQRVLIAAEPVDWLVGMLRTGPTAGDSALIRPNMSRPQEPMDDRPKIVRVRAMAGRHTRTGPSKSNRAGAAANEIMKEPIGRDSGP